jgi:TPR repeat protein
MNHINACCAECGEKGGASLKTCKSCMLVKYCNADCQKSHWPEHKKQCKLRAAEQRDKALFSDPPPKEDCPICFLPMPIDLINCTSLPPATISSVPIYDYANEHQEVANKATEQYYYCCGKSICGGCIHSCLNSGNGKCPFCNTKRSGKTLEECVEEMTNRVVANDPASIFTLGDHYCDGLGGLQQDQAKAMELYTRAAELGYNKAHNNLAVHYAEGGDWKKAKFHYEAAAMAGHEVARNVLGDMDFVSGNRERALKHWTIAASAGEHDAMHNLLVAFNQGSVSRDQIDSVLTAYNTSCAEMRSEARDAYIRWHIDCADER